jgi:hypothetical protein
VARDSGNKSVASEPPEVEDEEGSDDEAGGSLNTIPEMVRRVVATGLSGFFLTEEAFRRALGDTVPKDWSDFAAEQSERTRNELLDRLSSEIGRTLENVDVAAVLSDLLANHTIEVKAEFRLKPTPAGSAPKRKNAPKDG